jgi:Spy/CpxP family protein refolding chaperone
MKKLIQEENMRKKMTVVLAVASLLLLTSFGYAQPQGRMMSRAHMMRGQANIIPFLTMHQEELGITDEQLEKIKELVYKFDKDMIQLRSEGSELHLELKKLMLDGETRDYDQIKKMLADSAQNRHEGIIKRLKLQDEIHKILTPEQQDALKSMRMERFRENDRPFHRNKRFPRRSFRFRDWDRN